jgi:hypothetical protein
MIARARSFVQVLRKKRPAHCRRNQAGSLYDAMIIPAREGPNVFGAEFLREI